MTINSRWWSKIPYVVWLGKETVVSIPANYQPILLESDWKVDAGECAQNFDSREKEFENRSEKNKAPINNHWTVRELWNYPNFPYFVIRELRTYASCRTRRPFLWPECCANASRIPTTSVRWASRASVLRWPAADGNDENGDWRPLDHSQVDPDQNCRYLSLVL